MNAGEIAQVIANSVLGCQSVRENVRKCMKVAELSITCCSGSEPRLVRASFRVFLNRVPRRVERCRNGEGYVTRAGCPALHTALSA